MMLPYVYFPRYFSVEFYRQCFCKMLCVKEGKRVLNLRDAEVLTIVRKWTDTSIQNEFEISRRNGGIFKKKFERK